MSLYEELRKYRNKEIYPMHMPGHKRCVAFSMDNPYSIDVTELSETDNLYNPEGIIKKELDRLKAVYATKSTYMLVNGSTSGLLAAIFAACEKGSCIIMDRECHKSVYNAVELLELTPIYLGRTVDKETGISMEIDKKALAKAFLLAGKKMVSAVILTSPTYEGIVSDIEAISKLCHRNETPLIVDAAHGAHFMWQNKATKNGIDEPEKLGADIVVESLHKTLMSLTSTALLHVCSDRVSCDRIKKYLSVFQTSSPSYVLMSSISQCIDWLEKNQGVWEKYDKLLTDFSRKMTTLLRIKLWEPECKKDRGRLVVYSKGNGVTIGKLLRENYRIEAEMCKEDYCLLITSVADNKKSIDMVWNALKLIDMKLHQLPKEKEEGKVDQIKDNKGDAFLGGRLTPGEAVKKPTELVELEACIGRVCADYIFLFPPGIPILVPGEIVDEKSLDEISHAMKKGLKVCGIEEGKIKVIL